MLLNICFFLNNDSRASSPNRALVVATTRDKVQPSQWNSMHTPLAMLGGKWWRRGGRVQRGLGAQCLATRRTLLGMRLRGVVCSAGSALMGGVHCFGCQVKCDSEKKTQTRPSAFGSEAMLNATLSYMMSRLRLQEVTVRRRRLHDCNTATHNNSLNATML